MFIQNYGDKIQALNAATGDLIWEYQHELPELVTAGGNNLAKRNMAIYGDNLIFATSRRPHHRARRQDRQGRLGPADRRLDARAGATPAGPFVADGVIIQGMTSCGNAAAGRLLHHRPRRQDRQGTVARQHHRPRRPPEGNSWNGLPLESRFGASAWIAGSYDPDQNLVFDGVGQPYPWIAEMRGLLPEEARA